MPDRKPEWALNLSTELKKWVPEQGYKTSLELANELDIPRGTFGHIYQGTAIMSGELRGSQKLDGRIYYARLNLWTGLTEADPRNIPDRVFRIPQGSLRTKSRAWSENEYQQWLRSPDAQDLLEKKNPHFNREVVMEPVANFQPAESSPTVGSFVDGLVNNLTQQIASQLLENQKDMVMPQISELERRITTLESSISRLVEQSQVDRTPTPQRRISRGGNDIGQLATHLANLLESYKQGTSQDRDKLMHTYGQDLMALDMIVHPLTRRQDDREIAIKLAKEIKL